MPSVWRVESAQEKEEKKRMEERRGAMTDYMNWTGTWGEGGLFGRTRQRRPEDGKGGQRGWWSKKPLGAIQTTDATSTFFGRLSGRSKSGRSTQERNHKKAKPESRALERRPGVWGDARRRGEKMSELSTPAG